MAFTTTTARLSDGNEISYMDSGAVPHSTTYTSLVIIHGAGYNNHVFDLLHEFAPQYNLRIFAIQRRGYTGSSNYSDTELDELRTGNPVFFNRSTILFGDLISHLIQEHQLPEPNAEGTEGGVVLLSWSMGSVFAIPFLSDFSLFSAEQYKILGRYLTHVVFYDPPYSGLGFDWPAGKEGGPNVDPNQDFNEHFENFKAFVSSYYDHQRDWNGDTAKLDLRPRTEHATTDSWTPEQWGKIFQIQPTIEIEWHIVAGPIQTLLGELRDRVFFDSTCAANTFPKVKVIHYAGWRSNRFSLWAQYCMETLYKQQKAKGQPVRPLSFKLAEQANHFWHWDCPSEFLRGVADALRGR